ncbi:hypothetical protein H5410_065006 [Solanum commersonii]|uniref:Uncharacterized protein n=1 Tax=Solanum commersonii TaxID=4109 RepID=A0A9J5VXS2_SOLCO|nr:hypothetical protein H5410_065006 [Solanum commersonii]
MELWRRRNKKQHEGKDLSLSRIIHNVTRSMYRLIKVRRPWMNVSGRWEVMIKELEEYCTGMVAKKDGLIKIYTDGASRETEIKFLCFCLRDESVDIIHAKRSATRGMGDTMQSISDVVEEIRTFLEGKQHIFQRHIKGRKSATRSLSKQGN